MNGDKDNIQLSAAELRKDEGSAARHSELFSLMDSV
jgi:hypothetical protein